MSEDWHETFEGLDPSRDDVGYWDRFRRRALEGARPELARRRERSIVTVSDVVVSWSRAVVPAAVAAAAAAVVFLTFDAMQTDPAPAAGQASTQEVVLDGGPIPAVLELGAEDGEGLALVVGESF